MPDYHLGNDLGPSLTALAVLPRQSLLASLGFSCGFAASFNAPLAGITFAMEDPPGPPYCGLLRTAGSAILAGYRDLKGSFKGI